MPLSLTVSCSSKSRLVLTFLVLPFWYLLTRVDLDIFQTSSKTVVCVGVWTINVNHAVLHTAAQLECLSPFPVDNVWSVQYQTCNYSSSYRILIDQHWIVQHGDMVWNIFPRVIIQLQLNWDLSSLICEPIMLPCYQPGGNGLLKRLMITCFINICYQVRLVNKIHIEVSFDCHTTITFSFCLIGYFLWLLHRRNARLLLLLPSPKHGVFGVGIF